MRTIGDRKPVFTACLQGRCAVMTTVPSMKPTWNEDHLQPDRLKICSTMLEVTNLRTQRNGRLYNHKNGRFRHFSKLKEESHENFVES